MNDFLTKADLATNWCTYTYPPVVVEKENKTEKAYKIAQELDRLGVVPCENDKNKFVSLVETLLKYI